MATNPFGPGNNPDDDCADAIAAEMEWRGFEWDEEFERWMDEEGQTVEDAGYYLSGFEEEE